MSNRWCSATLALCCLLFVVPYSSYPQNLVPNPSFEDADTCTTNLAFGPNARPQHWWSFSNTPDYYRSCVPNGSSNGIPLSAFVYQHPYDGASFAGIFTYEGDTPPYREMIGTQLLDTLEIGQTYYVNIRVNAGTGGNQPIQFGLASNNVGILFTKEPYLWSSGMPPFPIRGYAQVNSSSVIADTSNWTLISGSFVADSAYRHVVIGNHFSDANTALDTIAMGYYNRAYVLIDAICVSQDPNTCPIAQGIEGVDKFPFILFPNPSSDVLNIAKLDGEVDLIQVFDAAGKRVWLGYVEGNQQLEIDISDWAAGRYLITFIGEGGRRSLPFIVMR